MGNEIERFLPLIDNILPDTDISYKSLIYENIKRVKDIDADEITEFLNKLLKFSALHRLSNTAYLDILYSNKLVLPRCDSRKLRYSLRLLVATLICKSSNSSNRSGLSNWFKIIPAVPQVITFDKHDEVSNLVCEYLKGTLEESSSELLAWSLQWITSYSTRIVPDYESNVSLQDAWVEYIDKNLVEVDRRIKALQDKYSGTYTLSLKFHEIDASTKFYTLDCSMSDTV